MASEAAATFRTTWDGACSAAGGRELLRLGILTSGVSVAGAFTACWGASQKLRVLDARVEVGPVGCSSAANVSPSPTQAAKVACVITRAYNSWPRPHMLRLRGLHEAEMRGAWEQVNEPRN